MVDHEKSSLQSASSASRPAAKIPEVTSNPFHSVIRAGGYTTGPGPAEGFLKWGGGGGGGGSEEQIVVSAIKL